MGRESFGRRAASAVLLMIGFYVLALVIAGALFYLPFAEWRFMHRVDGRLLVFAVVAGFAIWSTRECSPYH
ncbi:MAG: hypothetical protein ACREMY_30315 [bacterium]